MKACGGWLAKAWLKASDDDVVDAAALQFGQLVAQRADAGRRRFGPAAQAGEVVARVRLEGQHAGRQPRWRASLVSRASMAWWPRCTPSKLPIVSAQAGTPRSNPR
jgi:hypothetical protein